MALYRIDPAHRDDFDINEVRKNCEKIEFTGNNRRLSEGVFVTDEPIIVEVGDFRGAGKDKTVIIADFPEKDKPIIYAGSTPHIQGITICYRDGLVSGNETELQRVGISTINFWPLQKGSCIRDIGIKNVGTGVCSSGAYNGKANHAFSVMFDDITVTDFSYRGFDFNSTVRTGNIFSDIRLSSGKYNCDSAFFFGYDNSEKEESETDIVSLEIFDTVARIPLVLGGARALCAGSITLDNVVATDGTLVFWEKSSGEIKNFAVKNSKLPEGGNLFKVGGSQFITFETLNYLNVQNLTLQSISGNLNGFNLFKRVEEYTNPYYVKVEKYEFSGDAPHDVLDSFPVSGQMTFTKKGDVTSDARLCPFYSKKTDDNGKVLVWTGDRWQ